MTTTFIGTTFPRSSDWYIDENTLITNIQQQIDFEFDDSNNLFINTTWFGPQFDNGQWNNYKKIISQSQFDRVFLLAAADPVFLNSSQLENIQQETGATMYLLGHFDSNYYFNFHSQVLLRYFVMYSEEQLMMKEPKYIYLNYNRKPRDHRTALVNQLVKKNLIEHGIVTLGKQSNIYSNQVIPLTHLTLDETPESAVGNWGQDMRFGIPHDIHSLGNLNIWQHHFLNIIGETEFNPWDNMFISEKTWKPIIGMRPYVINGQAKIYQYLRDNGFKTFNHYWPHIPIETGTDISTSNYIVQVIEYLLTQTTDQINKMFLDMLLDLQHNRARFFEFATEEKHRIQNIFK